MIDKQTMTTSMKGVFCGGDLAGTAETAVEAAADGKIAAWSMHRHLQVKFCVLRNSLVDRDQQYRFSSNTSYGLMTVL